MFKLLIWFTSVLRMALSMHSPQSSEPANLLSWESCNYGDTIENLCNKCVCTTKGVYDCEPSDCPPTVLEVYLNSQEECHPKKVYNQGPTSCICTAEGQWPHKTCRDTFRHLSENSITKKTCKANGYFRFDCNVCKCNDKGEVDTTRCTRNECDEKPAFRRNSHHDTASSLFGTCRVKNWYSLAPCQFCYCMDTNKLVCSTSVTDNNKEHEMALGQSNLVLCGPGLLKEVAALVPGSKSYRSFVQSLGRLWPRDSAEVRSIKSKEETAKNTLEDDDNNVKGDMISELNKGRKAAKASAENTDDDDEDDAKTQNSVQLYRDVKEGMKSGDLKINLAANIDTVGLMPDRKSKGHYDPYAELRKFLERSRRGLRLDSGAKCKPGSITTVKCNICHCLKNGKQLCTDKKCD